MMKFERALAAALFAINMAPAAHATTFWQVTAEARAYANGSGGGGAFNEADVRRICNGTALYCSAPTSGVGVPPTNYSHSDAQIFALLTANASGSYPVLNSNPAGSSAGTAYAYADLATGELHISNSGDVSGNAGTSHFSEAGFQDTLHFAGLSSAANITFHVHVDGTFLGFQQPNLSFAINNGYNSSLYLYQDWYDLSITIPACVGTIPNCINVAQQPANTTLSPVSSWVKLGEGDYVGTFAYDPLHPNIALNMHLAAGGGGTSFADFSHTAGITFDLPSGLSFTSDSGTFLSAKPNAAVPEPATWATMLAGFGLIGGAMRWRRNARGHGADLSAALG